MQKFDLLKLLSEGSLLGPRAMIAAIEKSVATFVDSSKLFSSFSSINRGQLPLGLLGEFLELLVKICVPSIMLSNVICLISFLFIINFYLNCRRK